MTVDLNDALDQAVLAHFCLLFSVLMKEPTDKAAALERFKVGLTKLAEAEDAVSKLIREGEPE